MDGYMSKFSIYQGKKCETKNLDAPDCFGLHKQVVLYLTNDLFGKNHGMYFHNYFSSASLAEHLALNKDTMKFLEPKKMGQKKKRFSCLKAINDYNQHIGGVDKADFYCAIYEINCEDKKWWHRFFFSVLLKELW